jgi:integrase
VKRLPGRLRGPHVAKRTWRDPKSGERLESAWYFLFYAKVDERGARRRIIRRTEPPTDSKRVAEEQLRRALHGDPRPARRVTVADVLDGYLTSLEANHPSTFRSSGFLLRWWRDGWTARQLKGAARDPFTGFGRIAVEEFRQADVDCGVVLMKGAGLSKSTLHNALTMLRAAWRHGKTAGLVPAGHPVLELKIAFKSEERHVVWTDEELAEVAKRLPEWAARLLLLLRHSGLRVQEALSLKWENVKGDRLMFNQKGDRPEERPLTSTAKAILDGIPRTSEWVFPASHESKRPKAYRNLLRLTLPVRDELGIEKTIHDIRRTFAQRLQEQGSTHEEIAALLGQRSTRIVGRYTQHEMARLKVVAERAAGGFHDALMLHSARPASSPSIGESATYETESPLASDSGESAEGPSLQGIPLERVMGIEPTTFSLGS